MSTLKMGGVGYVFDALLVFYYFSMISFMTDVEIDLL